MTVGEFLMKLIFFSGISQKEAAEKIGVVPPTLNDIIKGKRKVNADITKKIEIVLGVPAIVWMTWQTVDELNKDKV